MVQVVSDCDRIQNSMRSENPVFDSFDCSCDNSVSAKPDVHHHENLVTKVGTSSGLSSPERQDSSQSPDSLNSKRQDSSQSPDSLSPHPRSSSRDSSHIGDNDQDQKDAYSEAHAHSSAKTTFFPKHNYAYMNNNDETMSNTNANARTYQEATEVSRRRHNRNLRLAQSGVFIADLSDDQYTDDTQDEDYDSQASEEEEEEEEEYNNSGANDSLHKHRSSCLAAQQDLTNKNTKDNQLLGDSNYAPSSSNSPKRPPLLNSHSSYSGTTSSKRVRSRSRSRRGSACSVERPADEFSRGVSFDTYTNKNAADFSLSLTSKHQDYHSGSLSRTFMCGTDKNKYSDNAATWLFREMIEDGDQVVCLRVVEPGKFYYYYYFVLNFFFLFFLSRLRRWRLFF